MSVVQKTVDEAMQRLAKSISETDAPEFDREAAIALVNKATDGLGQDESGDISGANSAIAQIAQLIISEAKDLAKMPSQSCDIHLLMSAVDALRCFARREQMEQNAVDPDSVIMLAADVDIAKGKYSAEQLRAMLKEGKAMKNPNGDPSYPIGDKEDLSNAIHAVGRGSGDHDAIRSYIKRRASALGASDMIPDSWKMAEATTTKADNVSDTLTTDSAPVVDAETAEKAADEVAEEVAPDAEKSADADDSEADDVTKTSEPDLAKEFDVTPYMALIVETLQDKDSELYGKFTGLIEAETKSIRADLTKRLEGHDEDLHDVKARLEKVEQMATPGGPALRRTEVERVNARKSDLIRQSAHFKALAAATEDEVLRKGYALQAHQFDAEIKAL